MSNFSSSCSSHTFCISHRKWREIVMMEISLMYAIVFHIVENQIFFWSSECYCRQYLCITSPEQSCSMHSWQYINFTVDRSDLFLISIVNSFSCVYCTMTKEIFDYIKYSHFHFSFCEICLFYISDFFFADCQHLFFIL